jgi:DNA-directed RNA polymerase subunit RPC12/RpoP
MAVYQELMAIRCPHCARRVFSVRVVDAIWPWLYDVASCFASTAQRAWLAGAKVRVPWECPECGARIRHTCQR